MDKRVDGGTAFPIPGVEFSDGSIARESVGMTLRDYFAGQVMVGLLASTAGEENFVYPKDAAKRCYEFADAMITERDRK